MSMRIVELEEERGSMAERAARAERQLSRSKEEVSTQTRQYHAQSFTLNTI